MHSEPNAITPIVEDGQLTETVGFDLGAMLHPVLPVGKAVPCEGTTDFSTVEDDQETLVLSVLRGNRPMAANATLLGTYEVTGFPQGPRGLPQIAVTLETDGSHLVVRASSHGTNCVVTRVSGD